MKVDFGITTLDFDRKPALPIPTEDGHNIICLGAGVQSSALVLMAAKGLFQPMPELAIFADTQAEPQSVYKWLDWLEGQLPFEVVRVTRGSLTEDTLSPRVAKNGNEYTKHLLPYYTLGADGSVGMTSRGCTQDYKIAPVHKELKRRYHGDRVISWFGISWDETQRMRDSRQSWIINRYPLIERSITREMCKAWMSVNGYPVPPRSACVYCPFHSDAEWIRLKTEEPEGFAAAVDYERRLHSLQQKGGSMRDQMFLHRARIPLDQVPFDEKEELSLFGNECEGMCGV